MSTALLDAARRLTEAGARVVPIPHGEKGPKVEGWPDLRLALDELPLHFNCVGNVGILLGEPSGGLVDVDLDCDEAVDLGRHLLPAGSAVTGRTGHPGRHWWYRCPGVESQTWKDELYDGPGSPPVILELRASQQTVVGPSVHPSGGTYDLLDLDAVKPVDADELVRACEEVYAHVMAERHGPDWQERLEARQAQRKKAEPLPQTDDWKLVPASGRRQQAERYMKSVPPAISGAGGHNATLWAARCAVVGFGLDDADALAILEDWNRDCQPPWSDKELRHKVKEAREVAFDKPFGWLVNAEGYTGGVTASGKAADAQQDETQDRSGRRRLRVRSFDTVTPRAIDWLWPNRIPMGMLTIIAGPGGVGKSTCTIDIAAAVTHGRGFPDGTGNPLPAGDVLFVGIEDPAEEVLCPRLQAAGVDLSRAHFIEAIEVDGEASLDTLHLRLDADLIADAVADLPDLRMIVIDPLTAFMGKSDIHRDNEVRDALAAPIRIAAERHVALVGVMHVAKADRERAADKLLGSVAFANNARAVWMVGKDRDDPARHVFLPAKFNIAKPAPGLTYEIVDHNGAGAIRWLGPIDTTADEAFAPSDRQPSRAKECAETMRELLADGPMPSKLLTQLCEEHGYSGRTIDRARKLAGVKIQRPQPGSADPMVAYIEEVGP